MNRRNVLVGLGTIVAGGGGALATGAFSSVEADRTVTVNTAGDSSALLQLAPSDLESNVVQETDGGLLEIDFGAASQNDEGVNLNALTTVGSVLDSTENGDFDTVDTEALKITNNGAQAVQIDFSITLHSSHTGPAEAADILKLWTDPDPNDNGGADIGGTDFGNLVAETLTLPAGQEALVAIQIDTRNYDDETIETSNPLFDGDATITANSQ